MPSPLSGCRVLDLGIITAGAATSAILSDLGAEVIKIESPTYRDPFRVWPAGNAPHDQSPDGPLFFRSNNRNKQGISLDLKRPEGKEAFFRLVAKSDVVVENFRRGVMEGLGLDTQTLQAINPDLIVIAISSQGNTGADRLQTSYGSTLEAVAGLAWATGYPGDDPVVTGRDLNYPDQVVAMFAANMVLAAWFKRRRGQGGAALDVSQRELTSFLLGETFFGGDVHPLRGGNADPQYAIQDCYIAQDGGWVAVSIGHTDLDPLRQCLGLAGTIEAPMLEPALAAWMKDADAKARVNTLRVAGIAAASVLNGTEVLAGRGIIWHHALVAAPDGAILKGLPFQIGERPLTVAADAPRIGQDTRHVLQNIAGYSPAEVSALAASGVIELAPSEAPGAVGNEPATVS